jgi:hypothetical protein
MNAVVKSISCLAMGSVVFGALGCSAGPQEGAEADVGQVTGAVRNGTIVTPFGPNSAPAETKNIVYLGGCTGTVVNPSWVLSAKHCGFSVGQSVDSIRPSGNVTRTADIVVNHPNVDVVMLHLSSPFTDVSGATPFYGTTSDIVSQTVAVYGYGAKAASGSCSATVACPSGQWCAGGSCLTGSSELRTGNLAATAFNAIQFETQTNSSGQMILPGDSGGPTFLSSQLAGVNSYWYFDLSGGGQASLPAARAWMQALINSNGEDLVFHNGSSGATQLWQMNGIARTGFTDVNSALNTADSSGWLPVARADFNKDGKTDIVWHNGSSGVSQVWYMDGATRISSQNFSSALNFTDSTGWRIVGSADFDQDGGADLFARNGSTGESQVWFMNGITRTSVSNLSSGLNTPDSTGWRYVGTGDFNADGKTDILWHNGTTGASQVWYMDGISRTSYGDLSASLNVADSSGWRPLTASDFNHDGQPDILWHDVTTGEFQVWYMNGIARTSAASLSSGLNTPDSTGWRLVAK